MPAHAPAMVRPSSSQPPGPAVSTSGSATAGPTIRAALAGTAGEVADAIAWLLSDQSSFTTGTTLDISGGR